MDLNILAMHALHLVDDLPFLRHVIEVSNAAVSTCNRFRVHGETDKRRDDRNSVNAGLPEPVKGYYKQEDEMLADLAWADAIFVH